MNDYITLKKRNTLKIGIKDYDGNPKLDNNGQEIYIEFDLEDINLPDNYSKCVYLIKKATSTLKGEITAINKREDIKGKGLMTKNQEEKTKALKQYYKDTEYAMNLFLGENGVNKIFGKTRYYEMWEDLSEMLEPIMPLLKINVDKIEDHIKSKYSVSDNDTLKNE